MVRRSKPASTSESQPAPPRRPTAEELAAAANQFVPHLLAPGLRVVFCGINPSLYSAAVGHHFARPGNRFWPTLHAAGFTDRCLSPFEDNLLPSLGWGLTNVVERATVAADELSAEELAAGAKRLEARMRQYRPRFLAVLGIGAYRTGFGRHKAALGRQTETIGETAIWVLPNPSGLNAHYRLNTLAQVYRELWAALGE